MACCGKARSQLRALALNQINSAPESAVSQLKPRSRESVYFSYLGSTSINVVGPTSLRVYRFQANAPAIAVDATDADALAQVPGLTLIPNI